MSVRQSDQEVGELVPKITSAKATDADGVKHVREA